MLALVLLDLALHFPSTPPSLAPGKAPRRPVVPSVGMTPHVGIARMHPGARIAPEQRKKRTVSDLCASVALRLATAMRLRVMKTKLII